MRAVELIGRLECVRETIRLALEYLERRQLLPESWTTLWDHYVESKSGPSLYGGSVEDQVSASGQGYVHDPGMGEHARRSDQRRRVDTSCSTGV